MVAVIAVVLFYFAGAGGTVFWIIGKSPPSTHPIDAHHSQYIGASVVLILAHAIAMTPSSDDQMGIELDDVTLEEVTIT